MIFMEYLKFFKKEILFFIKTQWRRPLSLIIFLSLAFFISIYWLKDIKFENGYPIKFLIIFLIFLVISSMWLFYRRLPKNRKGKLGFVVAISSDEPKQRNIITNDFLYHLRDLLYNSRTKYSFYLIDVPQYFAAKITNSEDARYYLNRTKAHFMIYGRARIREFDGEERHVLNLEGLVRHRPIHEEVSNKFSKEFSELFPRRLIIARENDLFSFEFTADWVQFVAMYIIGIASLLSGDLDYSRTLFENLNKKLLAIKTNLPAIIKIKQRLPSRITEVYLQQARISFNNWRQYHSSEIFEKVKGLVGDIKSISPNNYNACLLSAVCHFIDNRDIANAKKEIRKCHNVRDATWMYSSAFLYAYTGDLRKALRMYRRAFASTCETHVIFEVEEFICWVIEQEPEKAQLYFCLGLLNYFAKEDKASALRDFMKFIELNPDDRFAEEKRLSEIYIDSIKKEINEENP
jgi:tetratricopeptide (TPR) repeat protein